jgi:hypothetical protein
MAALKLLLALLARQEEKKEAVLPGSTALKLSTLLHGVANVDRSPSVRELAARCLTQLNV